MYEKWFLEIVTIFFSFLLIFVFSDVPLDYIIAHFHRFFVILSYYFEIIIIIM